MSFLCILAIHECALGRARGGGCPPRPPGGMSSGKAANACARAARRSAALSAKEIQKQPCWGRRWEERPATGMRSEPATHKRVALPQGGSVAGRQCASVAAWQRGSVAARQGGSVAARQQGTRPAAGPILFLFKPSQRHVASGRRGHQLELALGGHDDAMTACPGARPLACGRARVMCM